MINFVWDSNFKRKYKKLMKNNVELKEMFWKAIRKFSNDPFNNKLKTHKLSGQLQDLWSFRIDYNYRVIFRFNSPE